MSKYARHSAMPLGFKNFVVLLVVLSVVCGFISRVPIDFSPIHFSTDDDAGVLGAGCT